MTLSASAAGEEALYAVLILKQSPCTFLLPFKLNFMLYYIVTICYALCIFLQNERNCHLALLKVSLDVILLFMTIAVADLGGVRRGVQMHPPPFGG